MSTINLGQIIPNIQVGETTTLEPNQKASVTNSGDELNPILNFEIPKGEKGDKGDKGDTGATGQTGSQGVPGVDGKDGKDGKDGINGVDGKDGKDGKDGINGTNGVDGVGLQYRWNGTYLGVKREDDDDYNYQNLQGQQGANGQDGYTPVKGVDYFTPQDIASLNIPTRTLLWENEHPYEGFPSQSIDLSSANYDYLEIEFAEWAGNEETNMTKVVKNKPHRISEFFVPTDSKFIADTRKVEFTSETKLTFSNGQRYQVFNNNSSTVTYNGNVVVPRKIYGIKY